MALDLSHDRYLTSHTPPAEAVPPGHHSFQATLQDAFATAHVMWVDEQPVESVEAVDGEDSMLFIQMNSTCYWTTKPASHVYTFVNGKTTFTDMHEVVRTVELFRLVPMTSLEDQ